MGRLVRFVLWVGLGAVAGVLLAPRAGRELRSELRERAATDGYRGVLDGLADMGTEVASEISSEIGGSVSAGGGAHDPREDQELQAKIEETRTRLRDQKDRPGGSGDSIE